MAAPLILGGFIRAAASTVIRAAVQMAVRTAVRNALIDRDRKLNLRILFQHNEPEVLRDLRDISSKHMSYALPQALTASGKDVQQELKSALPNVFAGVSPFVQNSPFATVATMASPHVWAGIRDVNRGRASPADYVKEHFSSGVRGFKPMERAMQSIGVLPAGWHAVPGAGMNLDRFGNPNRRQVAEVIGALKSGMRVAAGRGARATQATYFFKAPGNSDKRVAHLAPGIWRSVKSTRGSSLDPMFLFVDSAEYKKVIDLPAMADRIVDQRFPVHLTAAVARAKTKYPPRSGSR